MTTVERAALTDVQAVGLTIWGEARSENLLGQIAVGCVIRNRVQHRRRWSRNWRRVCHQRWQFSCWMKAGGESNYQAVEAWAQWFAGIEHVKNSGDDFAGIAEVQWIARGLINEDVRDLTNGADHYFSPRAMSPRGSHPSWAKNQDPVAVIGRHRFYKLAP